MQRVRITRHLRMAENRPPVYLIAAMCDGNRGIGVKNDMPWHLPKEYRYFARLTTTTRDPSKRNAVIMGRGCWDSVPAKFRPLKGRVNVVLSRTLEPDSLKEFPHTHVCRSYEDALNLLAEPSMNIETYSTLKTIWNGGGSDVYEAGLDSAQRIYLTHILKEYECDRFFPVFDGCKFREIQVDGIPHEDQEEKGVTYQFRVYDRY